MKIRGFINVYPWDEVGAKGTTYGVHKTGNGIFPTREEADRKALPSRSAVAEFEYAKPSYMNLYKGCPWNAFDATITLGSGNYESEEAAQAAAEGIACWKPFHIGIVKFSS